MRTIVAILASLAIVGLAECPNACSGNGDCHNNDQCKCYPNFMGADCSERVCPFGLAFVDTPRGDLNHDGEVTNDNVDVMWSSRQENEAWGYEGIVVPDEAHFYTECSGKGLCDRELGECQCFDGYTGSSCQRTTCPNDCSGHGVCRTVEEIAAGAMNYHKESAIGGHIEWNGVNAPFEYRLWDADKNQACVCDPGYIGADCSLRECPRGDDPLTHQKETCGGEDACADEVQQVTYEFVGSPGTNAEYGLYFTWTAWDGMLWKSEEFVAVFDASVPTATIADRVSDALTSIPNDIFESVVVTDAGSSATFHKFDVTFTANPGNIGELNLHLSKLLLDKDGQIDVLQFDHVGVTTVTEGTKEEITCSGRGLCDYETGLCKCFKGYYHDDCSVQSALAM